MREKEGVEVLKGNVEVQKGEELMKDGKMKVY